MFHYTWQSNLFDIVKPLRNWTQPKGLNLTFEKKMNKKIRIRISDRIRLVIHLYVYSDPSYHFPQFSFYILLTKINIKGHRNTFEIVGSEKLKISSLTYYLYLPWEIDKIENRFLTKINKGKIWYILSFGRNTEHLIQFYNVII